MNRLGEMKLNYIAYFVIGFGLFAVIGSSLFNDTVVNYAVNGNDLGLQVNNSYIQKYNNLSGISSNLQDTEDSLDSGNQNPGEDANFFFNFDAIKGGVENTKDQLKFASDLSNKVSKDLRLPSIISATILTLLGIVIAGIIINLVVRWKANG